jgi:hypothetical protein
MVLGINKPLPVFSERRQQAKLYGRLVLENLQRFFKLSVAALQQQ